MDYFCRYDVNQSNIRCSDVKQSVSRDHTIEDSSEYEAVKIDDRVDCDVKMDANPAYHCDVKLNTNPAYQATS